LASSYGADFRSLAALRARIAELGVDVRLDDDLSPLWEPVAVGSLRAPNALAIHPMEGRDGTSTGAPGELTTRRYERYARGGAGLIWFEATAVTSSARANARELWLNERNVGDFARLLEATLRAGRESNGPDYRPITVLQITHSGRLVRSEGCPAPVIAHHEPALDARYGLPPDYPLVSDDELEVLRDDFVRVARLARQAGFDAVDVKACHGYLLAELLTARTRPGRYGGSFENRTRLLVESVAAIRDAVPDLLVAARVSGHDGVEFPYSWGMSEGAPGQVDLAEPIRLARLLYEKGLRLLSVTLGSRPEITPHPLGVVADHFATTRAIQEGAPELAVMGANYGELRHLFPYAAAANLRSGWCRLVGLGREAFANPDFPRILRESGRLDPRRSCAACGRCRELLSAGGPIGCVSRDGEIYRPSYDQLRHEQRQAARSS
jgi:2,4-dienoyl-CoA reductase (NADPH2)